MARRQQNFTQEEPLVDVGALFVKINSKSVAIVCTLNTVIAACCIMVVVSIGLFMKGRDQVLDRINVYVKVINQDLDNMGSSVHITPKNVEFVSFVHSVFKAMLSFSVFTFLFCILGCLGVWMRDFIISLLYVVSMCVSLMIYAGLFTTVATGRKNYSEQRKVMKVTIQDQYEGMFSSHDFSVKWNALMIGARCCGVDDYKDFAEAKVWHGPRNLTFDGVMVPVNMDMPLACCHRNISGSMKNVLNRYNKTSANATFDSNHPVLGVLNCTHKESSRNHKDRGCYDAVWDSFEKYTKSTLFLVINIIIIIAMVFSIAASILSIALGVAPERHSL